MSQKTVFLAATSDTLRRTQERVGNELREKGIRVVSRIPPPFEAQEHGQLVLAELKQADLAVHLLDGVAGLPIMDHQEVSYPQRQAELGIEKAKSQLIWLPKSDDMPKIDDHEYESFVNRIENNKRDEESYKFIRELQTPANITSTILDELNREPPKDSTSAVLLDTHFKDQPFVNELYQSLTSKNIKIYINPEEDDPRKNMKIFEALIKQVSLLIVIFGRVNGDWVHERIVTAFQIAAAERCPLRGCGVYLAPLDVETDRQFNQGQFPASLPIVLFDSLTSMTTLLSMARN